MEAPRTLPLWTHVVIAALACAGAAGVAELTGTPWAGMVAAGVLALGAYHGTRHRLRPPGREVPWPRRDPAPEAGTDAELLEDIRRLGARARAARGEARFLRLWLGGAGPVMVTAAWIILVYWALKATGWHGPVSGQAEAFELIPLGAALAAYPETEERLLEGRRRRLRRALDQER